MGLKLYLSHLGKMFQNRVLRGMTASKRKEVTRSWGIRYIEKLSNFYYSPNIIIMIKSRWTRWEVHVADIENKKCIRNFSKKSRRKAIK
jgi:hypothetical protein